MGTRRYVAILFSFLLTGCAGRQTGDEWRMLVDGQNLHDWVSQDPSKGDQWSTANAVALDADDPSKFAITPGVGVFVNCVSGKTENLVSKEKFGDVEAHIEFTAPQGSNSGIFFMGLYEVQVADSFGKEEIAFSDCGGFWGRKIDGEWVGGTPPLVRACEAPGVWQSFDVKFRAPRFDDAGNKVENARFLEVRHNGTVIHQNVEMLGPNSAHMDIPEAALGPLMLQGDHGPVAYRNVRMSPLK